MIKQGCACIAHRSSTRSQSDRFTSARGLLEIGNAHACVHSCRWCARSGKGFAGLFVAANRSVFWCFCARALQLPRGERRGLQSCNLT